MEQENSHGKRVTLFIFACCYGSVFILIRIMLSDIFWTTLAFPVGGYAGNSLQRDLTPSTNFLHFRWVSLYFIICSFSPPLQSVCSTVVCGTGTEGAGLGQSCCCLEGREGLLFVQSLNRWCYMDLGLWCGTFCLCRAGFKHYRSIVLAGTALYSPLKATKSSWWVSWALVMWKDGDSGRDRRQWTTAANLGGSP